jgi:hypothetical protein
MRLDEVSLVTDSTSVRLLGAAERGGERFEIYFKFPIKALGLVRPSADAFAAAMLLPAMQAGQTLEIVPPLSPKLLFNLTRIRDVFHLWYPQFKRIEISARTLQVPEPPAEPRAASFFSGGVDSFFTLLKYLKQQTLPAPLTHILFMRGVETSLDRISGIEASERAVGEVAAALGIDYIAGESNIRSCFPLAWEEEYCGSGLASVALALSRGFSYVCIPSGYSYGHVIPGGSSAVSDEMFGTEHLQMLHDGAETTRPRKLESIIEWNGDLVLPRLRVCTRNRGGAFNCGHCPKCVRTAIPLRVLGLLERAKLFSDTSMAGWKKAALSDRLELIRENLAFARERGADRQVIALLESVIRRRNNVQALRTLVGNSPLRHLLPLAPKRVHRLFTGSP